jgi:3-oxoacyl-[acyl-carrier-protein] synthase I
MRRSHFAGAALHTHLADTLAGHVNAVQSPAALVHTDKADALFGEQQITLPYRLLCNAPLEQRVTRLEHVLFPVIAHALQIAGLCTSEQQRCGLFLGTSSFDISTTEEHYRLSLQRDCAALAMEHSSSLGVLATRIRQHFDLRGPDYSFNTACTASANALVYADALIRSGQLDHALVVGVETFNSITALGFHGLQLLTPTAMRPFSPDRNGLVLGEGCAALMLSHQANAASNLDAHWRLVGSSNLCDTYGMSAANPDGSTVAEVMTQALQHAQLHVQDIHAIKTHGTASLSNDEAEAAGLKRVFTHLPPLTALKPYLGHTLGACGLNELLLFCTAADQHLLVGTPGIGIGDSKLGVTLNQAHCPLPRGHFMLNYFGFGGNNTSLIISNQAHHA